MLSYRHSFHAGNFADVLKHLVLVRLLRYLTLKDKPLCFIDTHAGAGGYSLLGGQARQTMEYQTGIGRLWQQDKLPALINDYVALVREFNGSPDLQLYPGSPWFAQRLLRKQDRIFLYELHSSECALLKERFAGEGGVHVVQGDGFEACKSLLPPQERRGLLLMDPPYEIKTDYTQVIAALLQAYRRFSHGVYALWYPVVERARIERLERDIKASGIKRVHCYELGIHPDGMGYGMTGSGMLVINPPWTLRDELKSILPYLAEVLGESGQGYYRIDELVGE